MLGWRATKAAIGPDSHIITTIDSTIAAAMIGT